MERIFGFDIGTTSIGWAVIEYDAERGEGRIIARDGVPGMGVRIFPEARDPDGTPLNQPRRQKRMMRRQLRRRKARRRLLNELLCGAGLLPPFSKDKDSEWAKVMRLDPYPLRVRGLSEPLAPHEFGRTIYHLAHRRHFRGRDLDEAADGTGEATGAEAATAAGKSKRTKKAGIDSTANAKDADEVKATAERVAILQILKDRKITLGQFLVERNSDAKRGSPPTERRRNIHAHRTVVDDEFDRLWSAQAPHISALKDNSFRAEVKDAVFAQRLVFWRKNTLGECRFMPGEALCPKAGWISQQKRMLEKLNNLAIAGGNARPLEAEERAAILEKLQTQASMTWGGIRSALAPLYKARGEKGAERALKFNHEYDKDEGAGIPGNRLEAKLAETFGAEWEHHQNRQAIRDTIHEKLWTADYGEIPDRTREKRVAKRKNWTTQRVVIRREAERRERRADLVRAFQKEYDATPEQAEALSQITLPTGWEPFSTAALKKFLPELEKGEKFGALMNSTETKYVDWRKAAFPEMDAPTGEELAFLPSPAQKEEQERIAKLRNPTVVRTQNELRKVVNNLIRVYGKPARIRVEMTRDIGLSKRERDEKQSEIRENERRRAAARKDFETNGIPEPSSDDIEKWLLWKESSDRCPYTGDQISFDALFREGRFEVEHIWPRWRSFDDGARNKTLCRKDMNAQKGNRTPFEAFGHDEDLWTAIKNRLDGMTAKKGGVGMKPGKVKRFLAKELPKDLASRQLSDTGYAARQAIAFLKRLWPDLGPTAPINVQVVTGKVTAQLRKRWELNYILAKDGEKTRSDHRHHAIDALVVACAHPGFTNKLSRYYQLKDELHSKAPDLEPPWPSIRRDAEAAVEKIVVSHRVRKKVSGPLHKETTYGDTGADVKAGRIVYRQFVTRKKVDVLTKGELEEIRDKRVGDTIRNWVSAHGGDPKRAFAAFPRLGTNGPEVKKVRLLSNQQMSLMAPVSTGFASMGSNHHMVVWRLPNGETDYDVVAMLEASKRLARRLPVVNRDHDAGGQFLMTLVPGDSVLFAKDGKSHVSTWRVQKLSGNGQVYLVDHCDASKDLETSFAPSAGGLISRGAKKVSIDPIGRVRPARD